jgi:hypothetical protein
MANAIAAAEATNGNHPKRADLKTGRRFQVRISVLKLGYKSKLGKSKIAGRRSLHYA